MTATVKTLLFCTAFDLILLNKVMTTNFEPFYGDLPFERYIERHICSVHHEPHRKWSFVYVHQLSIDSSKQTTVNSSFLKSPHLQCFTAVYSQINVSQLATNLNSVYFQYTEILTVINLQQSSSVKLSMTLTLLSTLYIACSRCLPFLLLLPPNAQPNTLKSAILLAQLNSTFPLKAVITFSPPKPQTFHLNPVLDGCAQTSGLLFEPQNKSDFSRLKSRQCRLGGRQLTVAVNQDLAHCHLEFDQQKNSQLINAISGAEADILGTLERQYHFTSALLYSDQQFSASYNVQRKAWSGIVGQVFSGTAHLGLCGLSDTLERRTKVDFTTFTLLDGLVSLTAHPGLKSRQWLALEPLSSPVWLLIGICFGLTLATLSFIVAMRTQSTVIKNVLFKNRNKRHNSSKYSTVETLYRILLKSCKNFLITEKMLKKFKNFFQFNSHRH